MYNWQTFMNCGFSCSPLIKSTILMLLGTFNFLMTADSNLLIRLTASLMMVRVSTFLPAIVGTQSRSRLYSWYRTILFRLRRSQSIRTLLILLVWAHRHRSATIDGEDDWTGLKTFLGKLSNERIFFCILSETIWNKDRYWRTEQMFIWHQTRVKLAKQSGLSRTTCSQHSVHWMSENQWTLNNL